VAASEVSGLSVPKVLEVFGAFFVHYIRGEGYERLLCCQGSTLKDWCDNINAIHQHLQTTFPKKMIMPNFWCTEGQDGSLILHYFSKRGNLLAPLAKGLVVEIAKFQFDVEIEMQQVETQGVNGSKVTSWTVNAVDPSQQWKLTENEGMRNGVKNSPTAMKCPFTGMTVPGQGDDDAPPRTIELTKRRSSLDLDTNASDEEVEASMEDVVVPTSVNDVGLSASVTKALFPYSIVVDEDFHILQIGQSLSKVLQRPEDQILGEHVEAILEITKPLDVEWNWDWMRKLQDQTFQVDPVVNNSSDVLFKTSVVLLSTTPTKAMLILAPDANTLEDLMKMDLTLSDLPVHGDYRDAVFLREHLSSQMNNTLKMEKLSKSLAREKQLLESLLPEHAAEGLRAGRTVEPRLHNNVTIFFSDIVGFTSLCKQIYPSNVIDLLNRLYCVMDFLALRFHLFKIETIGDAYVACSGLPQSDEQHAQNVANFAVAVTHCCQQILSPVSGEPIQLRIGIHTGPAASGVVGTTNPRYCVFGDSMNTTARHESTGAPGKVHCSKFTFQELEQQNVASKYTIVERGMVEMKGKGMQLTYWLSASEENELINQAALQQLDVEVKELLSQTNFDAVGRQGDTAAATAPGDLLARMGNKAMEAYIEEEVSRRLADASESVGLISEHVEDSGGIREVKNDATPVCPKSKENEQALVPHKKRSRGMRLRQLLRFV